MQLFWEADDEPGCLIAEEGTEIGVIRAEVGPTRKGWAWSLRVHDEPSSLPPWPTTTLIADGIEGGGASAGDATQAAEEALQIALDEATLGVEADL